MIAALEARIAKRRAQEGEPSPDTKQPPDGIKMSRRTTRSRLLPQRWLVRAQLLVIGSTLASKSPHVIALNTLVTANTVLLAAMLKTDLKKVTKHSEMLKLRGKQPADEVVAGYASRLIELWNVVI
jgi:hypothetical protein